MAALAVAGAIVLAPVAAGAAVALTAKLIGMTAIGLSIIGIPAANYAGHFMGTNEWFHHLSDAQAFAYAAQAILAASLAVGAIFNYGGRAINGLLGKWHVGEGLSTTGANAAGRSLNVSSNVVGIVLRKTGRWAGEQAVMASLAKTTFGRVAARVSMALAEKNLIALGLSTGGSLRAEQAALYAMTGGVFKSMTGIVTGALDFGLFEMSCYAIAVSVRADERFTLSGLWTAYKQGVRMGLVFGLGFTGLNILMTKSGALINKLALLKRGEKVEDLTAFERFLEGSGLAYHLDNMARVGKVGQHLINFGPVKE